MLHYAHNCGWNPVSRTIELVGADHNWGNSMKFARFDLFSNQFVLVTNGISTNSGTGAGHEFCGTAVDPTTGEVYYRHFGTVGVASLTVTKAAPRGTSFATTLPPSPPMAQNIVAGSAWWSGPSSWGGTRGAFMVFNAGNSVPGGSVNDGQVAAFLPASQTWVNPKATGASPMYGAGGGSTYHEIAAYSRVKNVMVYGGGNVAQRKLWKLDSQGVVTALAEVPTGKAVGIQAGNLREDPVTGNFLLLSANELWELNPDNQGSWSQLTGSRNPPAGVGNPGSPAIDGIVSCALTELGVVAYIKQSTQTTSSFFLYKHQ